MLLLTIYLDFSRHKSFNRLKNNYKSIQLIQFGPLNGMFSAFAKKISGDRIILFSFCFIFAYSLMSIT